MARRRASRPAPVLPARGRASIRGREPERRRLRSPRILLISIAVVGVVGFVGLALANSLTAPAYACAELLTTPPSASADEGFATESLGQGHVATGTKVRYGFCPPTSGSHYGARGAGPIPPGFYGPDAEAGPGGWVHNLEHGYVVALYRFADGTGPSEADLAALRTFAANGPPTSSAAACGYRSKIVVARFDDMSTPFAVVAWDRALLQERFDPSAAQRFASRWIEASAPEPNAC
ncbi:MAG: hypothetical protein C0498_02845 [Anaerolinea sp.]|nr:hypothetical protein [Anaerolinea sp.]